MNLLTSTAVFVIVYALYGCWFVCSRLARGSEVGGSLCSGKAKMEVAQTPDATANGAAAMNRTLS